MSKFIAKMLVLAISFVFLTFSGMAVFGMGHVMHGSESMHGEDCVSHCLSSTSMPTILESFVFLDVVWIVAIGVASACLGTRHPPEIVRRWEPFVGKYHLHLHLATVIIRD